MLTPRRRRAVAAVGAVILAGFVAVGCSDDDEVAPVADTEPPVVVDPVPAIVTTPVDDPGFVHRVLADGEVSDDELAAGYDGYIECLADGGGHGRFAYDISLRASLTVDWRVGGDDADGRRSTALDAGCSHFYLEGLVGTYDASHPPADDLAARQRDSIVACVEPISPAIVAAIPEEITTDTVEGGLYIDDPQLNVSFLGADIEQTDAVGLCFSTIGAEWHDFGTPPPEPGDPSVPAAATSAATPATVA